MWWQFIMTRGVVTWLHAISGVTIHFSWKVTTLTQLSGCLFVLKNVLGICNN